MSIFSTPISSIIAADLQELLSDGGAVENVRLEFKSQVPGKDETLKKLSSFANTFGGYMIVGAEAGNDGRITGLPGVNPQPNFKQTIIQWCSAGATPPITAEVSDPILVLEGSQNVCYVIAVPQSELAPHFLNGRKGVYVRTDEFSARFEPKLATEGELRHLLDRRRVVVERREQLISRSRSRFDVFRTQQSADEVFGGKPLPVFLSVTVVPEYPMAPTIDHNKLLTVLRGVTVLWRGISFPRDPYSIISQHESGIIVRPGDRWSILEANIWGMLSYATTIGEERQQFRGIHAHQFVGNVLVFLRHAQCVFVSQRVPNRLLLKVHLRGVRGVPWVHFASGFAEHGPNSVLDDEIFLDLATTLDELRQPNDALAKELLRAVFFAMNWPGAADGTEKLDALVRAGYDYNHWQQKT